MFIAGFVRYLVNDARGIDMGVYIICASRYLDNRERKNKLCSLIDSGTWINVPPTFRPQFTAKYGASNHVSLTVTHYLNSDVSCEAVDYRKKT